MGDRIDRDAALKAVAENDLVTAIRMIRALPAASAEPIVWQSTTDAYKPFVTDAQYQNFSADVRRWYVPYRCKSCAASAEDVRAGALDPATLEAVARMFDAIGNDAPLKGYECAKGVRGMIPEAKP